MLENGTRPGHCDRGSVGQGRPVRFQAAAVTSTRSSIRSRGVRSTSGRSAASSGTTRAVMCKARARALSWRAVASSLDIVRTVSHRSGRCSQAPVSGRRRAISRLGKICAEARAQLSHRLERSGHNQAVADDARGASLGRVGHCLVELRDHRGGNDGFNSQVLDALSARGASMPDDDRFRPGSDADLVKGTLNRRPF